MHLNFLYYYPCNLDLWGGMSTCDAIMCYIDYIYEHLNAMNHSLSVFVDLRKAFDTVDHHVLYYWNWNIMV